MYALETQFPYDPTDPYSVALEKGAQFTLNRFCPTKNSATGWCRFCGEEITVRHPDKWFVPVLREATKVHLTGCTKFAEALAEAMAA